jgi:hypothetical protein
MNRLIDVKKEFKKFLYWGYNRHEAAIRTIDTVFPVMQAPFLHLDKYEDPSHVYDGDYVLFFDDLTIYKKVS